MNSILLMSQQFTTMRAIQSFLPNPRHTETLRIYVKAKPALAWENARHFDGASIPWIKLLFDIRAIPDTIRGVKHDNKHIGIDQITDNNTGFIVLADIPGREVVVGSVGQFWHPNIRFANVKAGDFAALNKPGWGKLAWAISVEPYLDGSTVCFELRTTATDRTSWDHLNTYYTLIGIGSKLIRHSLMAKTEAELGKMILPDIDLRDLPGDRIITDAKHGITYHATIEAPLYLVWRYLMQLGCDRAGWYSIDFLDNGGHPSIDYLVNGWETRHKREHIAATPAMDTFFEVLDIKDNEYFIIGGSTERLNSPFRMTWAFITEPIGEDATNLVVRARMETTPKWKEWLLGHVVYPPVHGLMSAVQIHNIKKMAERDAEAR